MNNFKSGSFAEIMELYENSSIRKIFRPDFHTRSEEEQKQLLEEVPGFARKSVLDTSRNYYFFSVPFLVNELTNHVDKRVITKQDDQGGFPLVDRNYLLKIRGQDSEDSIDNYFKSYKDIYNRLYGTDEQDYKNILVPTYWTNYLVLLLLSKWKLCVEKNESASRSYPLENIVSAIDRGKEWFKKYSLKEGFPFSHIMISNILNTYDTCMALIAINYSSAYDTGVKESEFSGKEHLERLLNLDIRNEIGSWKKEPEQDNDDTGATAYATQTLLKYYRSGSDTKLKGYIKPIIEKGIEWLIANQREEDGGWGEFGEKQSEYSLVEKTSYALMALAKSQKILLDYSGCKAISRGLSFLTARKRVYKKYPLGFIWPNDYETDKDPEEWEDSLRNSSLAISAMLRCGVKTHDLVIQQGIVGTSRFYEQTHEEQNRAWYDPIYYFCMLADFLKRT